MFFFDIAMDNGGYFKILITLVHFDVILQDVAIFRKWCLPNNGCRSRCEQRARRVATTAVMDGGQVV